MQTFRIHLAALLAGCLMALIYADSSAQTAASVPDAAADAVDVRITGIVTAVDTANRLVSIKGPLGRVGVFAADASMKNFDSIKVGDRVELDYQAAVVLALRKGGDGIRESVEAESASQAPAGARPAGAAMQRTTLVANVEKVDRKKSIATLRGPKGRFVDVRVKDPQVMQDIKVGDQVVAVFYESTALAIRPAKAGAAK